MDGITIQEDEPEESVSPVVTDDDDDGDEDIEGEEGSEGDDLEDEEEEGSARERSASGAHAGVSGREMHTGPAAERVQRGASRQAELEVKWPGARMASTRFHRVSCTRCSIGTAYHAEGGLADWDLLTCPSAGGETRHQALCRACLV